MLKERLEELKKEFNELDDQLERYTLLLDLATYAPQPPCDFTTKQYLFPGCQANVWMRVDFHDDLPNVQITSDSMLMRGVALVMMRLLNGLPLEEYHNLNLLDIPAAMGLSEMFTSIRHRGIANLLGEIEKQINESDSLRRSKKS